MNPSSFIEKLMKQAADVALTAPEEDPILRGLLSAALAEGRREGILQGIKETIEDYDAALSALKEKL